MEHNDIEPWLFCTEPRVAEIAVRGGITHFVVDWESIGKSERQLGFDTEINADTHEDLAAISAVFKARAICRINRFGEWTSQEVEDAIALGASAILLPMVESADVVARVQSWVGKRCDFGVLLETEAACGAEAKKIADLGLDLVYVGLNDLAIARMSDSIFDAVSDGTVERLRGIFKDTRFGFGGLTDIDGGAPLPCRMLLKEMARLNCQFSFLRRSFYRDVQEAQIGPANAALQQTFAENRQRSTQACDQDLRALRALLNSQPVRSTLFEQMHPSELSRRVS